MTIQQNGLTGSRQHERLSYHSAVMTRRLLPPRACDRLWPLLALLLFPGLAIPHAHGQHGDVFNNIGSTTSSVPGYENRGGTMLRITVFAETTKTRLDRQSLVK